MSLLELSLGNKALAMAAIAHALSASGRSELPSADAELLLFVRAHLVSIVTSELGPRLALALFDDLADKIYPPGEGRAAPPSSLPPVSKPRRIAEPDFHRALTPAQIAALSVIVVDPDMIRRPAVARALIRARWNVTVVDDPAELTRAFHGGEDFAVALVDMSHPLASAIVSEVMHRYPDAAIVARSDETMKAHETLGDMGLRRFDVRSADAPAEELIDAIRRTLGIE